MNRIYRKKNYNIYAFDDEYIVHNTGMKFEEGHTHIKNFKTAKFIIDLAIHKSIPHHLNPYLLQSLIRISNDKEYKDKIQSLLDVKASKDKSYYYNRGNKQKKNYPKRTN